MERTTASRADRIPLGLVVFILVVLAAIPTANALSTRLVGLNTCDNQTVAGSAGPATLLDCSSGLASSIIIQNESATCIRVGGLTNLAATTGISVGDGCPAGKVVSVDAQNAYAISSVVGTVTGVDAVWGKQ